MAPYICILAVIFLRYTHSYSNWCADIKKFEHKPTQSDLSLSNLTKIGSGGQGTAYLDEKTNTVYKKNKKDDDTTKEYVITSFFSNEQNIIHTKGLFLTQNNELVIGLEYCESGNLDSIKMSENELLDLYEAIKNAIIASHNKCVAHKDLTMSNILICDGKNYKLADFGQAKQTIEFKNPNLTADDVWHLGLILFEKCVNDSEKWNIYSKELPMGNPSRTIDKGCKFENLNTILKGLLQADQKKRLKFIGIRTEHIPDGLSGEEIAAIVICSVFGIVLIGVLIYAIFIRKKLFERLENEENEVEVEHRI